MGSPPVRGMFGGVAVASEIELATLPPVVVGSAPALEIVRADVAPPAPSQWKYLRPSAVGSDPFATVGEIPDGYFVRVLDVGDFVVDRACRRLSVWSRRDDSALEAILLNHVVAPALQLRDRLVLHGSAVSLGGDAIAFLGPSGVGKSTLAAAFVDALTIADDAVVILDDLSVAPTAAELRLRDGAAEHFGLSDASRRHGRYPVRRDVAASPGRLRAVFVLEPVTTEALELRALPTMERLSAVLPFVERIDLHDSELLTREITRVTKLVDEVPMFALRAPRSMQALSRVCAEVGRVTRALSDDAR